MKLTFLGLQIILLTDENAVFTFELMIIFYCYALNYCYDDDNDFVTIDEKQF